MLEIEIDTIAVGFSEPIYVSKGRMFEDVEGDIENAQTDEGSSFEIKLNINSELCVAGEYFDIDDLDKSQLIVKSYTVFEKEQNMDGYYYTYETEDISVVLSWASEEDDDFDKSKLQVVYKRITFEPIDGKKWTHLFLDNILYDGQEPDDMEVSPLNRHSDYMGPFKV